MRSVKGALLATDLDGTLVGDEDALAALNDELAAIRDRVTLAYVTGRSLLSTLGLIRQAGLLTPDWIVSGVGTAVHRGPEWKLDLAWSRRLRQNWNSSRVRSVAAFFPALIPQPIDAQSMFKCSYFLAEAEADATLRQLEAALTRHRLSTRQVYSSGLDLDVLPAAAGKGNAVRHLAEKLGVALDQVVTCGDSGNDVEMLALGCRAVVVANARPELQAETLEGAYRSSAPYAAGVHEGLRRFGWL